MGVLQVSHEGLRDLSAHCSVIASALTGQIRTGMDGPSTQSTSAAVARTYGTMATAAAMLAARVGDTAEKLTAAATDFTATDEVSAERIAVDTNSSAEVPGGGQKGVITMFPLAGGSGVVEVQKGWTLTPPWVNNYAPIN